MNSLELQSHKDYSSQTVVRHAGFWRRFVARMIDLFIVNFIISIPLSMISLVMLPTLISDINQFSENEEFVTKIALYLEKKELENENALEGTWAGDYRYPTDEEMLNMFMPFFMKIIFLMVVSILITLIIDWLYNAILERSSWQGSIGKKVLSLMVVDEKLNRISFARATGRYFGQLLSSCILLIGYFMAGFTSRKQSLHDIMSGCQVVIKTKK